ncbi:hypothetical protein AZI86_09930 [Bdellovibrio bacteriovorus]|uniref:Major facilitator superfamily (MFS) profile domain-containing protein n=1 Tax=Bdellovibrio bacteriovorus TaxID=959 RepID=A0A150WSE2_BDEBC|nr:MFS transporter [Bdellovibrio bacteriovorus]KYG67306.1 hypothetical protein AZI86_09930 [Bdellovibrio bacteriovorus]
MVWPFIIISYASLLVYGLSDNIRGPLFPEIMKHFAVSDSMGSLIFALGNISGLISSYACRHLLRRYDRLTVLRGGAIGLIFSLLGLAIAPYFWVFLIFAFTFGLSQGVIGLIPNVLVSLGSSAHRKQQMLSGLHTMYGVASLMAPLLAAGVELVAGNWRWTFAVAMLAPISLLAYSFHGSHKNLHTRSTFTPEEHKAHKAKNFKPQIFLALMLSFAVATELMLSSRLALYMQRVWNYDMETSSLYVSYFFIFMMLGRGLFTLVHFRQSARFLLTTSIVSTGAAILLGVYIHPLFLAFGGFTIAPFYPLSISWISSEFPQDLDTVVSYMMATDSLMLIVMHLAIGKVTDLIGIQNAILSGLGFVVLSFVMINSYRFIFHRETAK